MLSGIIKFLSLFLIVAGLTILSLIYTPILKQELNYWNARRDSGYEEPGSIYPISSDFGLVIPKIGVNVPVKPNVDPNNRQEYLKVLLSGVAHAKGSALPGQTGNIFLFAHSADTPLNITRYNAVFYLLGKLEGGDEIRLYYRQSEYFYRVVDKRIVPPEIIPDYIYNQVDNYLVLQTCHPPGTTLNRLIILAEAIN